MQLCGDMPLSVCVMNVAPRMSVGTVSRAVAVAVWLRYESFAAADVCVAASRVQFLCLRGRH